MSRPQYHSEKSRCPVRNGTRGLPAYSAVPQPAAPPRAPITILILHMTVFTADRRLILLVVKYRILASTYLKGWMVCQFDKGYAGNSIR